MRRLAMIVLPLVLICGTVMAQNPKQELTDRLPSHAGEFRMQGVGGFCSGASATIPDDNATGVTSSINIGCPGGTIGDLDVLVQISHTWVGDLRVELSKSGGPGPAMLINRPGLLPPNATCCGCSGNNIDAILSDEAATAVETQCAAAVPTIQGTFIAGDPADGTLLTTFDGSELCGMWSLKVSDHAGADIGTLDQWCLLPDIGGGDDGGEECEGCNDGCNCCSGGDGLGCDCPGCEAIVCGADPFCCDTAWDSICDGEGTSMCSCCTCEGDAGGDPCNCCSGGDGLGCDCADCESVVCGADPFCCDTAWDGICDNEAQTMCTCCRDGCGDGGGDSGGDPCNCCSGGDGLGCDCADCESVVCGADPFCCDTSWDGICDDEAETLCTCCQDGCGDGGGDDGGEVEPCNCCSGGDGLGCDCPECENVVCSADPFCCDVAWDGTCDNEALTLCTCCDEGCSDAENVNAYLDLKDLDTDFSSTPCTGGTVGTLTIDANFVNDSSAALADLFFSTAVLTNGNVVCNADGGPGGVGSTVTVPLVGDLADNVLTPSEDFDVSFDIGLTSTTPFDFFVDAFGTIIPDPTPAQPNLDPAGQGGGISALSDGSGDPRQQPDPVAMATELPVGPSFKISVDPRRGRARVERVSAVERGAAPGQVRGEVRREAREAAAGGRQGLAPGR